MLFNVNYVTYFSGFMFKEINLKINKKKKSYLCVKTQRSDFGNKQKLNEAKDKYQRSL